MPPTAVEVATARGGRVADRFTALGSLEAELEVTLVSEVAARIEELSFEEGRAVAKGALIARLDDAQLRAEVVRAEALVLRYQSTYDRVQNVVARGAGTPQDLDDAQADLSVAKADLALVRARLTKTRIRAPFAGVAGARRVSPGAFVQPGDVITQLAQIERLRVVFDAPERTLGRLDQGARVEVRSNAYPDLVLSGQVDIIEPVLNEESRSARIVSLLDNRGGRLRPGMSADVTVVLGERSNAITVPSESVFFEGQQAFVFVITADSTVQRTAVGLGTRMDDAVEVIDGLLVGDEVVRAGHQKLYPGAKVQPVHSRDDDTATAEAHR